VPVLLRVARTIGGAGHPDIGAMDGLRESPDQFVGILNVAAAVTLLLTVLIAFAPLFTLRRLHHMDVPAALRIVE